MKNLFKVAILLAFVFSSLVVSTGAYAAPSHVSRQTIPSNFTIGSQFMEPVLLAMRQLRQILHRLNRKTRLA